MFTLRTLITALEEADKIRFEGLSYHDDKPVYTGDLWRIWPSPDGLESEKQHRLYSLMEDAGMHLHFEDETITDEEGKVHLSQPGYYGDLLTWTILEPGVVWSRSMAEDTPEDYLDALLAEGYGRADKWGIDFAPFGFVKFDYQAESGWYAGQTDTPEKVAAMIHEQFPGADIVFAIDGAGQFDVHFSAWYRPAKKEEEEG